MNISEVRGVNPCRESFRFVRALRAMRSCRGPRDDVASEAGPQKLEKCSAGSWLRDSCPSPVCWLVVLNLGTGSL